MTDDTAINIAFYYFIYLHFDFKRLKGASVN